MLVHRRSMFKAGAVAATLAFPTPQMITRAAFAAAPPRPEITNSVSTASCWVRSQVETFGSRPPLRASFDALKFDPDFSAFRPAEFFSHAVTGHD
jgi:hypothetical protein